MNTDDFHTNYAEELGGIISNPKPTPLPPSQPAATPFMKPKVLNCEGEESTAAANPDVFRVDVAALERELAQARRELAEWQTAFRSISGPDETPAKIVENIVARDAAMAERLAEVEGERDGARAKAEEHKQAVIDAMSLSNEMCEKLEAQLATVTRQLEKEKAENLEHAEDWAFCGLPADSKETKYLVTVDKLRKSEAECQRLREAGNGMRDALRAVAEYRSKWAVPWGTALDNQITLSCSAYAAVISDIEASAALNPPKPE